MNTSQYYKEYYIRNREKLLERQKKYQMKKNSELKNSEDYAILKQAEKERKKIDKVRNMLVILNTVKKPVYSKITLKKYKIVYDEELDEYIQTN
jgi:hypothetical protein